MKQARNGNFKKETEFSNRTIKQNIRIALFRQNDKTQCLLTKKKKRICHLVDFVILAVHRVKIKESEKIDKYLEYSRSKKKLSNMRVVNIFFFK